MGQGWSGEAEKHGESRGDLRHLLIVELTNAVPELVPIDKVQSVYHHLALQPQAVARVGINRNAESRPVRSDVAGQCAHCDVRQVDGQVTLHDDAGARFADVAGQGGESNISPPGSRSPQS